MAGGSVKIERARDVLNRLGLEAVNPWSGRLHADRCVIVRLRDGSGLIVQGRRDLIGAEERVVDVAHVGTSADGGAVVEVRRLLGATDGQ